jgi:hypothetical protein
MKPGAAEIVRRLINRYGRNATLGEVFAKMAKPKRRGRPKKYDDVIMPALGWLAVELERDKGSAGRRLTITKACQNLANKAQQSLQQSLGGRMPGWHALKKHHERATRIAREDSYYGKTLNEGLAVLRQQKLEFVYPLPGPDANNPELFQIPTFEETIDDAWRRGMKPNDGGGTHGEELDRELADEYRRGLSAAD